MKDDTIAAIATAAGEGAIAIVRLSGPQAIQIAGRIFYPRSSSITVDKIANHRLVLGWVHDSSGEKIDEVLLSIMRGPHSYTGEDCAEINCHGGAAASRLCLESCLQAGARLAEPGEYTRRAYLNGRLDLQQAEAVVDVIRSRSEKALKMSVQQLAGENMQIYSELEDHLSRLNALVEASIDFPVEVGDIDQADVRNLLNTVEQMLNKLIRQAERASVYRDGIQIVICGKPNVGKSSLLNKLVRKDRAIVTDIPGTTRDVIEEYLYVKGIPVKLVDTAGIHITEDVVEKIGIDKSRQMIRTADAVIFVMDASKGYDEEDRELLATLEPGRALILINKEDLGEQQIEETVLERLSRDYHVIHGSVIEETGIEELENAIEALALKEGAETAGLPAMINIRQKNGLQACREYISSLQTQLGLASLDCMGVDAWGALDAIGEITGHKLRDESMDRIFYEFCIGK